MQPMKNVTSKRVLVVAAAASVAIGAVGAAAASKSSSTGTSFLDRVASHLGISTKKLQDATKAAAIDQVDADLEAGRITKAQADAMKAEIEQGEVPLFFGGPHRFDVRGPHRFGDFGPGAFDDLDHHGLFDHHRLFGGGHLSGAADYLDLSVPELMQKLAAGKSLADVAKEQDKSVDGLKQAMLDAAKSHLDQAVDNGLLTEAQAKRLLGELQSQIDDIVHARFPGRLERRDFRWRPGPPEHLPWRPPPA